MPPFLDLAGQRFGRLLAIRRSTATSTDGKTLWECRCECGEFATVRVSQLTRGRANSCGCLRRDVSAALRLTHGRTRTAEYNSWTNAISRCYNKKNKCYARYGGRGIRMCSRWRGRGGFGNFLADMGERPGDGFSLERKDNDGDYCPENCKWADRFEQARNKENVRLFVVNGKTMTIRDCSKETGLLYQTVWDLVRNGWSIEELLAHKRA